MLRRLGVRGKILATLAVPVLVLSLAAVFLSGSAVSDARLAESNQQIVDALDAQDFMTRAMQKERSAAFAVGGQAEGAEAAYRFARVDTDRSIAALETRLDEVDLGPVDDRLVDTIRAASGARSPERLESVRRLLSTNAMTSTKTVQTLYDDIIDSQMAVSETASNRMDDVRLTELLNGYNAMDQTMNQFSISTSLARWILQTDLTEKAIADARYGLAVEVSAGDLLLNDAAAVVAGLDVPGVRVPAVSAWSPLMRAALGGATPDDLALAEESSWAELGTMEVEQIRPPGDQVRDEAVERAGSIRSEALQRALITISIAVLAVLTSVAIALLVARRITEPLRRLTKAANDVRVELPRLVEQVAVPGKGPELDFARIPVEDDDEVGQLASAFNDVNETTLDIAREQALLRGSIAEMFVNVARRDQALLSKQLAFLDELERSEEDPNILANLFRLDHFATRMRRNAESLLVLAGIESGRRVRDPMPLSDVIRTASSEIEQYERIQLEIQTDPSILGHHALITAHLLAELLENATEFSEPGSPVMVRESEDVDWVTIEIVDTGLGMSAEEIDEANRKTAVYAGGEIVGAERLGLYVVGRLAHRLGASVRFANLDSAVGVRVWIRLPKALFRAEVDRTLPEPTDPLSADTRAATEAWVTPDLDVARVNDEMDAFRDQEPPLVTAVDLDSLTEGLTATGMPRRRSRAVDPSAPAPSEALTGVGFESNLDHVLPPDGVAGISEGGVEWNPTVVPSAGGLTSHTAREVEANLVARTEKPAQSEQDTAHSMPGHTADPVLESSPLFVSPAEQTGLSIPGLVDLELLRNDEDASSSQHQFNTKGHFSDPLAQHENVADRTEPAFPVEPLPTSGPAASKVPEANPVTNFEPLNTEAAMTEYSLGVDDAGAQTDRKTSTTVAMDFGRIELSKSLWLYLFGTPGQDRFLFMWDDLVRGAIGAVVLVDTDLLDQCFPAIDYFESRGIPFVVGVNCFDGIAKHRLEDIREALQVPAHVPMLYTDARSRAATKQTLVSLVQLAMAQLRAA